MKRIGVFVDVQNIYFTTKDRYQQGGKINYEALRNFIQANGDLVTLCAFTCFDPVRRTQMDFISALGHMGYRVVSKPIKKLADGTIKANMDLEMAMEVLNQAPHLDEVVLVTGDGDFVPLVNQLCANGKIVKVVGPDQNTAPELIHACNDFINLHQIQGILELK